nr:glycoside hydrolase family 28 protein [Levilactobacillus brevis]
MVKHGLSIALLTSLLTLGLATETNISSAGAKSTINGDTGKVTLDKRHSDYTYTIQSTINHIAKRGGGVVNISSGTYHLKYLTLRSNIELHLSAGTKLIFSDKFSDFPGINTRYEGAKVKMRHADIYGKNVHNVSISGTGTIDGNGSEWWKMYNDAKKGPIKNVSKIPFKYSRPYLIAFDYSSNIKIKDVKLQNSPAWTVHPLESENVTIQGITIDNPLDSPNTDGIDPESSKDIKILENTISDGDDCIAIKSGTEATAVKSPSDNILIANNVMKHGHGGVTFGSEMSGGIQNVTINNNIFDQTDRGIRMKTRRGRGGQITNVSVSNIIMKDVLSPLTINAMYGKSGTASSDYLSDEILPVTALTPDISNISLSNITATNIGSVATFVYGIPESPVKNLSITDSNFYMNPKAKPEAPEMIDNSETYSGSGLWLRNTIHTTLSNVNIYNSKTGLFVKNKNNSDMITRNIFVDGSQIN